MNQARGPSMFDVASCAGVSHQTVSRVLNNHKSVSKKTRDKVNKAMKELGYRPNSAARALVTGKTATFGVLSHNTTLFGPASTLHAFQSEAREKNYKTTLFSPKDEDRESIILGIHELINDGVDGIVIIAPQIQRSKEIQKAIGNYPAVLVEGEYSASLPSINVDQQYGSYELTRHLIKFGHRNIAHISGPKDWYESRKRIHGFKTALEENALRSDSILEGDWSAQSGYELARQLVKDRKITAIFAGNDSMALGALRAMNEIGLDVPNDISLVGFDDLPESRFLTPTLTTARQDFNAVGAHALNVLLDQIERKKIPRSIQIKPKILIRESSAKRSSRK
jgi:DNA-binding LacI/PurR family transcriptional regulator